MFTQDTEGLGARQAEECFRGCLLPCDRFTQVRRLTSRLIQRKAGQLPIGKGPDLDATKEGGTADQSIFNSDF